MDFDFMPLVFGYGVSVDGSSHLTIRQDGSSTFSGHVHDSGASGYNVSVVCTVEDSQNMAYTFQHSGYVYGALDSGSRDDDWTDDSQNNSIADYWADLAAGSGATALANAEINGGDLTASLSGTSYQTSTTPTASASASPRTGLSTGAKGGIIAGSIIAGLALVGVAAFVVMRKRRSSTTATRTPDAEAKRIAVPEIQQDTNDGRRELEATRRQVAELGGD
jgi:hypothetical protein